MGLFEFLMVLVSVVIGLGVTEVLTGWANPLRARKADRFYLFLAGSRRVHAPLVPLVIARSSSTASSPTRPSPSHSRCP